MALGREQRLQRRKVELWKRTREAELQQRGWKESVHQDVTRGGAAFASRRRSAGSSRWRAKNDALTA